MIPTALMADLLSIFTFDSEEDERRMFDDLYDALLPYWAAFELLITEGWPEDADTFAL